MINLYQHTSPSYQNKFFGEYSFLQISSAYTEQVNFHGNSESVWIAWAKWEIEERRNFDKARAILLSKAPLYHPKSTLIKREVRFIKSPLVVNY